MINTFFITLLFSHALTWTQAIPTLSHPPTVWKRDGAPLFGASGMPSRDDIGQHEGDCGWLSSMAAITTISPFFVKSKFAYSSSSDQSVTDVRVTIFTDDASLTAQVVPVTYHSQLINNDNEDTSTAWWPGAYDSAAVYSGTLPSTNGSLNPVGVTNALQILTGKEAAWKFKGDLGDEAWEVLNKGTKTPVVLQTLPTGAVDLVGGHAYAVLNTSIAVNGTKMVALFNPWGDDVVYTYDTAMNDCYLLAWLKNNDTLKSTESSSSSSSPPSSPLVDSGTFCSETDNGVSTSTSAESRSQSVRTLNYKDTSSSISSSFDPTLTSAPEGVEENIVWVTEMVVITKFVYD